LNRIVESFTLISGRNHRAATTTDKRAPSAKILVVDDHPANLTAVAAVLEPLGEPSCWRARAKRRCKQLLSDEFAVVLLDVMMPGMTGFAWRA